jgi:uncharacterized membrane protein/predicted DsbA family dithiol-disulfide isomerase
MKTKKKITPMSFEVYFLVVALFCLVGFIDAIYLAISHYRVYTDIDYRSFCALSKAINCDTVSQSAYSIFLNIPVSIWGVFGYLLLFLLLLNAWQYRSRSIKAFWPSIFIVALAYSLNSIVLEAISFFMIRSHCIMCILSHAMNFGILFYAWLIHKRFNENNLFILLKQDLRLYRKSWRLWSTIISAFASIVILTILLFPPYWQFTFKELDGQIDSGITTEGYPWIGAADPEFVIQEFSDYQCFQCKKMHHFLRQLVARHRARIRLVHRHFPMDQEYNPLVKEPFHTGSGKMSIIALFAQAKNQFWEVNDLLFDLGSQKKDFNTKTIAEKMGVTCGEVAAALRNRFFRLRLKHDIAVGIDLGITGTPGFLINGQVYIGTIPKNIITKMMAENG